jgi:hypothetical protein
VATEFGTHASSWHTRGVGRQIDHRHVIRLLAMGRIGLGTAMLLVPGRASRAWLGEVSGRRPAQVAVRALGARDLAVGVGMLRALDSGDNSLRDWVTVSGACDLSDAVATLLAYPSLPTRGRAVALLVAAGAAAATFVARDRLGR